VLSGRTHELHSLELEALGLEASDDLADEASLDTVRLDHDVSAFHGERRHLLNTNWCRIWAQDSGEWEFVHGDKDWG